MVRYYYSPSIFPLITMTLGLGLSLPHPTTAQPRQDYGLGLPSTAGSGGGTRHQPELPTRRNPEVGPPAQPINPENMRGTRTIQPMQDGVFGGAPDNPGSSSGIDSKPHRATPYGLAVPALPAGSNGMICLLPQGKAPHNCLSNFPRVILLSPDDGGRTSVERPTLYWYVTDSIQPQEQPLQLKLQIFATAERDTTVVYQSTMKITASGLYRFTLPPEIALQRGTYQRWQVQWQQADGSKPASANSAILWETKKTYPTNWQQLDLLARARWYSRNYYWHDAVAAYILWLEQNPRTTNQRLTLTVKQELLRLLTSGLSSQGIFSAHPLGQTRLHHLLQKITAPINLPLHQPSNQSSAQPEGAPVSLPIMNFVPQVLP
jgi:hypothetical protein